MASSTTRRGLSIAAGVLLVGLAATLWAARSAQARSEERARLLFATLSDRVEGDVRQRLARHVYGLSGVRAATAVNGGLLDVGAFSRYVAARDLTREFPGVVGMGMIEAVPRDRLAPWTAAMRAQHGGAFEVRSTSALPTLYVIRSIEPIARNRPALGFDAGSEPARRAAVQRAFALGFNEATAPVALMQDPLRRWGTLYMMPVFASGRPERAGGDDPVIGVVYAAITYAEALARAKDAEAAPLRVTLHDVTDAATGTEVFRDLGDGRPLHAGLAPRVATVDFGGRTLRLSISATDGFHAAGASSLVALATALGTAVSLAFAIIAFWLYTGRHAAVAEARAAYVALEHQRRTLQTTLQSIGDAVLTTDAAGRVTWLNPVAERLTQYTSADARGLPVADVLRLRFEDGGDVPACPAMRCLAERRVVQLDDDVLLVARDGVTRYAIEDSAAPLLSDDGDVIGAVVVFYDVTEKRALAREMTYSAGHDPLTGLLNRRSFEGRLEEANARAAAGGPPGALMFIDLDHFKTVNDSAGHVAGDALLVDVGTLVTASVRAGDAVARFGGDEFAVLLEGCALADAEALGHRLCEQLDVYRYVSPDGARFRVGASVGIAPLDAGVRDSKATLQAADQACIAAKDAGRGRVAVAGPDTADAPRLEAMRLGPMVEQALDEDRLVLMGQRIVPLSDRAGPDDIEVLVRLVAPDGTMMSPASFIPVAERYKLAREIDCWVLSNALHLLEQAPPARFGRLCINISGQSVGDPDFHRYALDAITACSADASRICLEITETSAIRNLAGASTFLQGLRSIGVRVALDDFGTGTASFSYLKQLPVDCIKVDGQFVRDMLKSPLDLAVVRSFVDVGRVIDVEVVAEQVEDVFTEEALRRLGVQYAQGFLFHRPERLDRLLGLASPHPVRPRPAVRVA